MSASLVAGPVLIRIAPRASSAATPIAASTCEGATLPDEQADPDETAICSFARQSVLTWMEFESRWTASSVAAVRRALGSGRIKGELWRMSKPRRWSP